MTYKLDGDLLVVEEIGSLKDDTKRALANLLPHSIVHTYDIGRRRHGGDAWRSWRSGRRSAGSSRFGVMVSG